MTFTAPVLFKGMPGSPYTRKMLAYLRFRHIPYRLLLADQSKAMGLPTSKVALLPTFYLPNERGELEAVVDSTPLIRRFEVAHPDRLTVPDDPILSLINDLIEDYADEWLTKAMFHYRWYFADDIEMAGKILPRWRGLNASDESLATMQRVITERQTSRLFVVGSNEITAPVIEASYQRFLTIFDDLIRDHRYVFGARPSSADFGLYAQLTQLAKFDPTPSAICLSMAPRVYAWTDVMDDLSGVEVQDQPWPSAVDAAIWLTPLLTEIGRVYVPALLANAQAIADGLTEMRTTIDERDWVQPTFAYQAKCLAALRSTFSALTEVEQKALLDLLQNTQCAPLFETLK